MGKLAKVGKYLFRETTGYSVEVTFGGKLRGLKPLGRFLERRGRKGIKGCWGRKEGLPF